MIGFVLFKEFFFAELQHLYLCLFRSRLLTVYAATHVASIIVFAALRNIFKVEEQPKGACSDTLQNSR
jgi:hypothetical protein